MTDVTGRNLGSPIFTGICDRVVVLIRRRPLDDWQIVQKMLFDRVGSLAAIILLSPLLLILALLVRMSGPGPIIFRQIRVGFNNQPFVCFKFRSMHHNRCDTHEIAQATRHDPRVDLDRTLAPQAQPRRAAAILQCAPWRHVPRRSASTCACDQGRGPLLPGCCYRLCGPAPRQARDHRMGAGERLAR